MIRVAAVLVLLFLILLVARVVRFWLASRLSLRRAKSIEGEMVRDPVCGVWIDRRLAIAAGRSPSTVPVCSEECRRALEQRAAP